jgi:hypothetical protein
MDYFDEALERLKKTGDMLYARLTCDRPATSIEGQCSLSHEIRAINDQIVLIEGIRERKKVHPAPQRDAGCWPANS